MAANTRLKKFYLNQPLRNWNLKNGKLLLKRPRIRRISKSDRSRWIKEIDSVVSKMIRSLGYCQRCLRQSDTLQCCHIIPRTVLATRWNLINLLCLCYRCHFHYAHKDPIGFTKFVKRTIGEENYAYLERLRSIPYKIPTANLQFLLKKIEEEYPAEIEKKKRKFLDDGFLMML